MRMQPPPSFLASPNPHPLAVRYPSPPSLLSMCELPARLSVSFPRSTTRTFGTKHVRTSANFAFAHVLSPGVSFPDVRFNPVHPDPLCPFHPPTSASSSHLWFVIVLLPKPLVGPPSHTSRNPPPPDVSAGESPFLHAPHIPPGNLLTPRQNHFTRSLSMSVSYLLIQTSRTLSLTPTSQRLPLTATCETLVGHRHPVTRGRRGTRPKRSGRTVLRPPWAVASPPGEGGGPERPHRPARGAHHPPTTRGSRRETLTPHMRDPATTAGDADKPSGGGETGACNCGEQSASDSPR